MIKKFPSLGIKSAFIKAFQQNQYLSFVTTWKTDNAGVSASNQITIPVVTTGAVYDCVVDWGDGTLSIITTFDDPNWTHTYATAGTYEVKITGVFNALRFGNGGDKLKILDVSNWGIFVSNGFVTFQGCSNMTITAKDTPQITNWNQTFRDCASITTFAGLGNLVLQNGGFNFIFAGCTNFNEPSFEDIDTSLVTNIAGALSAAPSFDQKLGNLKIGNATNMNNFLASSELSAANTNLTYVGWAAQAPNLPSGITIHMGTSKYNTTAGGVDGVAAKSILTSAPYNLAFIDGGIQ